MKVRAEGAPKVRRGDTLIFTLRFGERAVRVAGRITWTRRQSFRVHVLGVAFTETRPGMRSLLRQIAQYGFVPSGRDEAAPTGTRSGAAQRPAASPQRRDARPTAAVADLYSMLGISSDATPDQVHAAYRRVAGRVHPDRCSDADATERFSMLTKAYSVLKNPELRARYDALRSRAA
ncbi:MAG: J domain-containing protein [Phycisphaerae bacterium]|nr:J domain-containing protein [Phycisphaerae bacterium]